MASAVESMQKTAAWLRNPWKSGLRVVLLLALIPGTMACAAYTLDIDIAQERLDIATPPLNGSHAIVQSFVCQHPNLCEIELLPAVYQSPGQGKLTLYLRRYTGNVAATEAATANLLVAQESVDVTHISHNVPLRFAFTPQSDSAGKQYELSIEGSPGVQVGFWYNSVDSYRDGGLKLDAQARAGDLRFITRCRYDPSVMLCGIGPGFLHGAWLIFPLIALLLLPGYLLWHGLGLAEGQDPVANLAQSLAISLALLPVALLWSTVFGLRWGRNLCLVAFTGLTLCALIRLLYMGSSGTLDRAVPQQWGLSFRAPVLNARRGRGFALWKAADHWPMLTAAVLLFLTILLRFVQIRDLALPAWVDSPQHALITELVATQGQVPRSYEPLLPVQSFIYHFGFHADAAVFHWLSGLPIPQAMLILGQVLNAASALTAYLLTLRLTGRKLAASAALCIVGLVSYMPAYYVTWGRYTQLTGLVLLPAALVTAVDWLETERREYRLLFAAGLTQAGVFLTHARVAIYGNCFLIVYCLYQSIVQLRGRNGRRNVELGARGGLLALLVLGFSAPWILQMITGLSALLRATGQTLRVDPSYNAFPTGLLFVPRNRELIALAVIGAASGLLRHRRETVLILAWISLVTVILNPGWLGLPVTGLVNNATAVISLFLPLAVLDGQTLAWAWERSQPALTALFERLGLRKVTAVQQIVLFGLMLGIALWGSWGQVSIVNPTTILATGEDVEAMAWIKEHTAPDALFLINTRHWQLGIYTGSDGGYWIPQLTNRRTLLPVIPYVYASPDDVQRITTMAQFVSEVKDADDPRLLGILEREKVTHIYIGAKGGNLTSQMFLRSAYYRPVYSSGAVWIFEVTQNRASLTQAMPCWWIGVTRTQRGD